MLEKDPLNYRYNISWLMRGWLMSFIKCYELREGAELGCWRGGTTFFLLDYEPRLKMHAIDIFELQEDHPTYCKEQYDFTESYPYLLKQAEKYGDRIKVYKGWTHEVVREFKDYSLDFVFIDADHSYEAVKRDILDWRPKVCPGGFVMGHDIQEEGVQKAVTEVCSNYTVNYVTYSWVERIL